MDFEGWLKRRFGPGWTGFMTAIGSPAVFMVLPLAASIHFGFPDPPAEAFARLLEADLGLLVAFSVTLAAIELRQDAADAALEWLTYGCGWGIAALIGLAGCIALSVKSVDAPTWLDLTCLWWTTFALLFLGIVVALGPVMIYRSKLKAAKAPVDEQTSGGGQPAPDDMRAPAGVVKPQFRL